MSPGKYFISRRLHFTNRYLISVLYPLTRYQCYNLAIAIQLVFKRLHRDYFRHSLFRTSLCECFNGLILNRKVNDLAVTVPHLRLHDVRFRVN